MKSFKTKLIINLKHLKKFLLSLPKASAGAIHENNGPSY